MQLSPRPHAVGELTLLGESVAKANVDTAHNTESRYMARSLHLTPFGNAIMLLLYTTANWRNVTPSLMHAQRRAGHETM